MTFEKFDRRAALTLVGLQLALLIEAAQVSLLAKKTTGAVATQKRFKQMASDIFGDVVRAPPIFNASSAPHR
jgi:ABC-type Zn uptake system ZnuABC Zn-binding protein ZnuA